MRVQSSVFNYLENCKENKKKNVMDVKCRVSFLSATSVPDVLFFAVFSI
jgi:hypothetical protein